MSELLNLKFTIRRHGQVQELTVDADSALVGSAPHCEIRLGADEVAPEQLEVRAGVGGVAAAEVRSRKPEVRMNGVAFNGGRLLPESVLTINGVELGVQVGTTERYAAKKSGQGPRVNFIHALGAVGFPFLFYVVLSHRHSTPIEDAPVEPPALFTQAEASCPERDAALSGALADKLSRQAQLARERAPFSPEDGVLAARTFASAAKCAELAGQSAFASANQSAAEQIKTELTADFHVHQVRLERALEVEQYDRARVELRVLMSFLVGRDGEYTSWLANVAHRLDAAQAEGKKL